jgi:hypothetical protein
MSTADGQDQLGQVLINFSTNGAFPEEESVSAAYVQKSALAPALAALATARSELEVSFPGSRCARTVKLTGENRQRSVKLATILLPMSMPGLSTRSLYRMISIGQGV